jgi:hypothetical protein
LSRSELGTEVAAFNTRDPGASVSLRAWWTPGTPKARVGGDKYGKGARVVSQGVAIATGVSTDGSGEGLGCAVGDSQTCPRFPVTSCPALAVRSPEYSKAYQVPIANGATIMPTASTMMAITIAARAITSVLSLVAVITLAVAAMAAVFDLPGRG